MIEIGARTRNQPPPPHIVIEALTQPDRDPTRPWLILLDDEQPPRIEQQGSSVIWTSMWRKRPDAVLEFDCAPRSEAGGGGTDLTWRLFVDPPIPEQALAGHMRKRVNELINANLRYTFG